MTISRALVVIRAYAKINLDLRVLGRHADGYHELRTVFQTIDLHDTLTFDERPGPFELQCRTPGVPLDEANLVWKAAARVWTALGRSGVPCDVRVTIDKSIPIQAGLGGGSADAAATLKGLMRLWGKVPPDVMQQIAAELGADVAFFLCGGTALGLGRGDDIYPLIDLPSAIVVLVQPPFGVSTAEAYRWFDADQAAGVLSTGPVQRLPGGWPRRAGDMRNDLEAAVGRRQPAIAAIVSTLREAGAVAAAMSGSGSAVFGLFDEEDVAARARVAVESAGVAMLARTLGRGEYRSASRPSTTPQRHSPGLPRGERQALP